jgi:hypothetical protein
LKSFCCEGEIQKAIQKLMKIFFRKLFLVLLELAIIAGALWFVAQKKGITNINQIVPAVEKTVQGTKAVPFPAPQGSAQKKFAWQYKGQNYSLSLTMYQSVYDYYSSLPKNYSYSGALPSDWENQYYGMFLKQNAADDTIQQLAQSLQALGKQHGLTDDQVVEMTMAFVQTIPYDDAKAKDILADTNNETMQYPYETLFSDKGVCSDKSLLAYSILKQMGYGVALFAFEQDNHMAIGIQCPVGYSNYNNGYCYGETTSIGNKIGIIPSLDSSTNKTVDFKQLSNSDPNVQQQANLKQLGPVTVFQNVQGKQYSGIIATKSIENEIAQLSSSITSLTATLKNQKTQLNSEENNLNSLKNQMDDLKKAGKIDQFNLDVSKYNAMLEDYKNDINSFNNNVSLYNKDVGRYNGLIAQ